MSKNVKQPQGSSLEALVGTGNDLVEVATIVGFYEQATLRGTSYDADLTSERPDYVSESIYEYTLL